MVINIHIAPYTPAYETVKISTLHDSLSSKTKSIHTESNLHPQQQ